MALDIGASRIGVALASAEARLPQPYTTLSNNKEVFSEIKKICDAQNVNHIVLGLPRGLAGQDTAQTEEVRRFASQLRDSVGIAQSWQDEALTSIKAEAELNGRKKKAFDKGEVDALAATYILEDYLGNL